MNKKRILLPILLLIIILLVISIFFLKHDRKEISKKYVRVTSKIQTNINENKLYTNYEEFNKELSSNLKKEDFNNSNYLLIPIQYDGCSEENLKIKDYDIANNSININITYTAKCGGCAPEYIYYAIPIDKKIQSPDVELNYKALNDPNCPVIAYKPIIYLYPKEKTNVTLTLDNSKDLKTSYPRYKDNWQVTAYPDGTLLDEKTNKHYYGLYWEGKNHKTKIKDIGFIVPQDETITFLEEKLSILGLTEREANEFIIYWLPKLEQNKYNYIYFETSEEINNYMPITISPQPDTIIRILMDYKPLTDKISIKEEELTTPKREGFTVVEWGGSIIE